jgi:adenylate cyclase
MGQGLLLEFPPVLAAVEFAIATQTEIADRSQGIPESEAIRSRMGVDAGDGVNIAPRIEPLGEPDGISLSDDAYLQFRDRLAVTRDGGEHEVKNVARPIHVWPWQRDGPQAPARKAADAGTMPPTFDTRTGYR